MAWLLRKRSILKGELGAIDRALEALPRQRIAKAEQLASIDAAIRLHEVQVEPTVVAGRRKSWPRLVPAGCGWSSRQATSVE